MILNNKKMILNLQLVILYSEVFHLICYTLVISGLKMERILPKFHQVYYFGFDSLSPATAFIFMLNNDPQIISPCYLAFALAHFAIHSMAFLHLAFPMRSFYWTKAMENVFKLAEGEQSTSKRHLRHRETTTAEHLKTSLRIVSMLMSRPRRFMWKHKKT